MKEDESLRGRMPNGSHWGPKSIPFGSESETKKLMKNKKLNTYVNVKKGVGR